MAGKTIIGIDFHYAEREGTGNCTYMRNLVEAVVAMDKERRYILYVTAPEHPYYERFRSVENVALVPVAGSSAPARMLDLGRATFRDRPDILHVNYYAPPGTGESWSSPSTTFPIIIFPTAFPSGSA